MIWLIVVCSFRWICVTAYDLTMNEMVSPPHTAIKPANTLCVFYAMEYPVRQSLIQSKHFSQFFSHSLDRSFHFFSHSFILSSEMCLYFVFGKSLEMCELLCLISHFGCKYYFTIIIIIVDSKNNEDTNIPLDLYFSCYFFSLSAWLDSLSCSHYQCGLFKCMKKSENVWFILSFGYVLSLIFVHLYMWFSSLSFFSFIFSSAQKIWIKIDNNVCTLSTVSTTTKMTVVPCLAQLCCFSHFHCFGAHFDCFVYFVFIETLNATANMSGRRQHCHKWCHWTRMKQALIHYSNIDAIKIENQSNWCRHCVGRWAGGGKWREK